MAKVKFIASIGAHLGDWYRGVHGDWRVGDEREINEEAAVYLCREWPSSFVRVNGDLPVVGPTAPTLPRVMTSDIRSNEVSGVRQEQGGNVVVGRKGKLAGLVARAGKKD